MNINMTEISEGAQEFSSNISDVESYITNNTQGIDFTSQGLPNPENARVIGVYGGKAPGVTFGGVELQVMYAQDQETGETGVFFYAGGTAGPSIGLNDQSGAFIFDGPLDQIPGISYGVQGSSGVAVGYSRTPSVPSLTHLTCCP